VVREPATFTSVKTIFLLSLTCTFALLTGCGTATTLSAAEPAKPLTGTEWKLAEMDGKGVAVKGLLMPTLQLDATTKHASGTSGVNRYSGSYEASGANLKFGPLVGTKMGGPPAAMAVESAFLKAMASVSAWNVTSNRLELKAGEKTVLRFQAQ
jgi:heat shock protein HslJ